MLKALILVKEFILTISDYLSTSKDSTSTNKQKIALFLTTEMQLQQLELTTVKKHMLFVQNFLRVLDRATTA